MTPPTRRVACLNFCIEAISLPFGVIGIDILPDMLIAALAADHMVVKRGLPNRTRVSCFMHTVRNKGFILPNYNRKIDLCVCKNNNRMNMVGHYNVLIDPHTREMGFYLRKPDFGNLSK